MTADLPIIAAPMAGGASTVALIESAARAGGYGFLPLGYLDPDASAATLAATRRTGLPFGVNVFVPGARTLAESEFRRYAAAIAAEGNRYGLDLGAAQPHHDDDHWRDKLDLLLADPAPVVSFTFGFPDFAVIRALRRAGSRVLITVTSPAEAKRGQEAGVDGFVVQGWAAGGHSGTTDPNVLPESIPLPDAVRRVRAVTSLPLVATGGVATAEQARDVLAAGAEAVAVGTALLLTDESGASAVHRAALRDPRRTCTVITRVFTGRPARALRNRFINRYDEFAPTGYPEIHHLTHPLRAAAAARGEPELVHLWAGTGYRHARTGSAADVFAELARLL